MATKKCAREECGKTVYPMEELKCLEQVWHKQCFKCTTCGMTLSMKSYKGYEKKPYCEAHYPKTVASVVADTPEMLRLKENTKFQSQVQYHADYEKMKGTKIEIADDPELQRHLQNTKVQSQVQYHGEHAKKLQQDSDRPNQEITSSLSSVSAQPREVGSIADYDPLNGNYGSAASKAPVQQQQQPPKEAQNVSIQKTSSNAATSPTKSPPNKAANQPTGFAVKALYDYTAADKDEVSFRENDIIVNCQKVDDGWMTGTVQRTLTWGMLPANYVERVNMPTGMFKLK